MLKFAYHETFAFLLLLRLAELVLLLSGGFCCVCLLFATQLNPNGKGHAGRTGQLGPVVANVANWSMVWQDSRRRLPLPSPGWLWCVKNGSGFPLTGGQNADGYEIHESILQA